MVAVTPGGEGGGTAFARGPMACVWFPAVVLLANQIRIARTMAMLRIDDASESKVDEDALVAIAEGALRSMVTFVDSLHAFTNCFTVSWTFLATGATSPCKESLVLSSRLILP